MNLLKYIWKNSMMKIINSKMGVFVILMLVLGNTYVRPIRQLSKMVDYPSSWCLFPFVMCSFTFLIFFWFGVIYVNSDVPFMQHINMYHAIRIGRRGWALGQIGGIFVRSFCMVLVGVVSTILPILFRIEWTTEWGKLLRTAGMTEALRQFDSSVFIFYEIFAEFSPLELMGLQILVTTLICVFIGLLMFLLSLFFHRMAAVAGSLAFAIALFIALNTIAQIRYRVAPFIPTIWAQLARIKTPDVGYYWMPSIPYILGVLIGGILSMSVLILIKVKRIEFNWEDEDQ